MSLEPRMGYCYHLIVPFENDDVDEHASIYSRVNDAVTFDSGRSMHDA